MPEPIVAQKGSFAVELEKGEYWWCSCGGSKKQPLCDGTHKEKREFKPHKFELTENQKVWLCGCKHTGNPPFCDGTHKKI